MNKLKYSLLAFAALALSAPVAQAVQLDLHSRDAVLMEKSPQFNVKVIEASNTTYKLVAKDGTPLSGYNYGYIDIAGTVRKITGPVTLTQAACATNWGSSGTHNVYLYAGWTATAGVQLCVSDIPNKTTVGATAVGNTGYVACSATLASSAPLRQLGSADLNCTGPVIGTYAETDVNGVGKQILATKAQGTATSATAAAALVFTIRGLESGDRCTVTPVSLGTGPNYVKFAAVTANTLTVTFDTAQSGGSTVIQYVCY